MDSPNLFRDLEEMVDRRTPNADLTKQNHLPRATAKYAEDMRPVVASLCKRHATPFYFLDDERLKLTIKTFQSAFADSLGQRHRAYYAIKSNYHAHILRRCVGHGLGLDASSERELDLALDAKARHIVLTGPGKSDSMLRFAVANPQRAFVHLDSYEELERLVQFVGAGRRRQQSQFAFGIRLNLDPEGSWGKFGLPLTEIPLLKRRLGSTKYSRLKWTGVHFHSGQNRNADTQIKFMSKLKPLIAGSDIRILDLGGGYYPENLEGRYSSSNYEPAFITKAYFEKLKAQLQGNATLTPEWIFFPPVQPIYAHAQALASTIEGLRLPADAEVWTEPGRWISAPSTSLVMRVVALKPGMAILDGGLNMLGWEFGSHYFYPIFNLSSVSRRSRAVRVYGNLCTPRDFFGYQIYSQRHPRVGDLIFIPNQGAYRFSLAQNFIHAIPKTIIYRKSHSR